MLHRLRNALTLLAVALCATVAVAQTTQQPLRIAIVGLTHGHTAQLLKVLPSRFDVTLVGISEPDPALRDKYAKLFHLPENLFYDSEAKLLDQTHPEAILIYTSPLMHRAAMEMAARQHVAVVMEKPFSTTLADALAMQRAAAQYHVPVLVNYATTWFRSNIAAAKLLSDGSIGDARKLVIHDGHQGPKETGVSPEFFNWLTDPTGNGAGALFDFGCYGVDLATWIMHGELPLTVTAITLHIKPDIYPKVDDDSTILLTYPHAQAIIQGSWSWPYARKDMEIYGVGGSVKTVGLDKLQVRLPGQRTETEQTAPPIDAPEDDPLHALAAILHGKGSDPDSLSGVNTNVKVMRILEAARESAKTGHTITLKPQKKFLERFLR